MNVRRATYEDVLNAPPNMVAEIIDGVLCLSPRPPVLQTRVKSRLLAVLGGRSQAELDGPEGWVILQRPELHLGPVVVVPSVAG